MSSKAPLVSSAPTATSAEAAVTARTQIATVGDRRFAFRIIGAGSPVLCLQRFRGTMDDWDPRFVDAVAASHRVILFDNAGVSSSSGEVPMTLGAAADDAVAFARSLGIDKVSVLGWSMVGLIAQEIAIRHSDFATQAIVIGAVPPGPTPVPTQPLFSTTARKSARVRRPGHVVLHAVGGQSSGRATFPRPDGGQDRRSRTPGLRCRLYESDGGDQELPRGSGRARED